MHVDEVLQKCDQTYVIFDTSIILDYIRLSSRNKNHRLEILSYIINNCRNKATTLLNLEEILVGSIGNKEEIENFIFYSFKILNITEKETEVAAELEAKVREEGLRFKGENWRIDLFIASFAYTHSYYILTKDSDFKKILDCKEMHIYENTYYLCNKA
ncbi:type II toxin-antitoxin system VapC family toxin [Sulfurisphaera ohwakuensis]|uniref:PIN domain-containing protein n=1 Tax=Sulfurisphaera ohwakuensis TaxID=69656 RepID=A0A650CIH4_SULOH|nr:PIN domain-containing protein [Sulfurisphaera ohwakuensis]MBB5255218.1 hypothetical protein [Sulfurisphaera ohwakuensis]QGR17620.1 PIN domain-containing protein [Sulfurisphaera ohwakuensis]